jgi:hypothetical protein
MTKRILLFSMTLQLMTAFSMANTVSSADFNTMIEAVTDDQMNTAHVLWDSERVKDYIRRKRTLQNTRTMIADTTTVRK